MGQPIRKKIQETHPDLIKEEDIRTLIIDGNSLLFMSFKDNKINSNGIHYGGVFQFLLQVKLLLQKGSFDYCYCFFDNTYSGWMRYNIYPLYKANRDKHYNQYAVSDYMKQYNETLKRMQKALFNKNSEPKKKNEWNEFIDANFDRERDILIKYFEELYIRCYMDEITEGDDLIAYYCKNKKDNEKIYIVSGDMDLMQLLSDNICIYNLHLKKFVTNKNFKDYFGYRHENIVIKKILCGDTSDNIGNIKGLSEEGFLKLMPEAVDHPVTLEDVRERCKMLSEERKTTKKKPLQLHENILNGVSNKEYNGDFFEINRKLIDLSEPMVSDEAKEVMDGMMYAPIDPEGRSFKNLYKYILEDGIDDIKGDTRFASFFNEFKKLEEKEVKRYKESLNN